MKCKECASEITRVHKRYGAHILYCSIQCRNKRDRKNDRRVFKEWLAPFKDKPCMDCNNRFLACCMEFDHRPGEKKLFEIGRAKTTSLELRLVEIAKCDLVCANCHRIRTELRRGKT